VVGGLTAWGSRSNRPGQSEQVFALCCSPVLHCCIFAGGALCGVRSLVRCLRFLFEHDFVSDVSSRCPCLRGPRLVFFK
jgi:hypothetical protein